MFGICLCIVTNKNYYLKFGHISIKILGVISGKKNKRRDFAELGPTLTSRHHNSNFTPMNIRLHYFVLPFSIVTKSIGAILTPNVFRRLDTDCSMVHSACDLVQTIRYMIIPSIDGFNRVQVFTLLPYSVFAYISRGKKSVRLNLSVR